MLFDKKWFEENQKILLWFSNTFIGKWTLCINGKRSDVGKKRIVNILPNAITWVDQVDRDKIYCKTEFRTHNKFSKRLFHAFKPLWYLFHFWDTLFANNFQPAWNLGFDTLTVYPDAGDPGTTTVDGKVGRQSVDEVWSTIRTAAGNYGISNLAIDGFVRFQTTATTNQWAELRRAIFLFDTSSLNDVVAIHSGSLSICGTGTKTDALAITPTLALVAATPASNTTLASSDYGQFGTTELATRITYAGFDGTDGVYNPFTLNAAGLAAISKTGVSKFGVRNGQYDLDNSTPTWSSGGSTVFQCYWADQTGTSTDPKLVVVHLLTKKISGVSLASIKKVSGVSIASVKKVAGLN